MKAVSVSAIVALFVLSANMSAAEEPAAAIERAKGLFAQSKWAEAAEILNGVIQRDAQAAPAYVLRAQVLARQGDTDRALADADRAVQLAPQAVEAWEARGLVQVNRAEWDAAIDSFGRALAIKPTGPCHYFRAYCHVQRQQYDAALPDLSRAMELLPDDESSWDLRGEVYRARGKLDQAIEDYTHAVRAAPTKASYREHRAQALIAHGDYRKAVADLAAAIEYDRRNPNYWNSRCVAYSYLGQWEYMRRDAATAVELAGDNGTFWYNLALADSRLRRSTESLAEFGRAIELMPKVPVLWFERSQVRTGLNDWRGALEDCRRVTELDPQHAAAWNQSGVCHLRLGEFEASEQAYTKAVATAPEVALYRRNRAALRAEQRTWDEARADYEACLKLDSSSPLEWFEAGLLAAYRADNDTYQKIRRAAWERFGSEKDAATLRTLAELVALQPGMTAEVALLDKALALPEADPSAQRYQAFCQGLLAYRAGNFKQAQERLKDPVEADRLMDRAKALLVLAMSQRQLGQDAAAEASLQRARAVLVDAKHAPAPASGVLLTWQGRFYSELLIKEAEGAANSTSAK